MSDNKPKQSFRMPDLDSLGARRMFVLVAVAAVAFLGLTKIKPQYDQANSQTEQVEQVKAKVAELNENFKALKATENDGLSEALMVALPTTFTLDEEYKRLTKLARRVGAEVTAAEQSAEPQAQSGYQKLGVTLRVECPYEGCLRFLGGMHGMVRPDGDDGLEAHGPIWVIDQFQLTPGDKIQLALTSAIYMSPNANQAAAPDTATATPTPAP